MTTPTQKPIEISGIKTKDSKFYFYFNEWYSASVGYLINGGKNQSFSKGSIIEIGM